MTSWDGKSNKVVTKASLLDILKKKSAKQHLLLIPFCGWCYFWQKLNYFLYIMDCILCTVELCVTFFIFFVPQIKRFHFLCKLHFCYRYMYLKTHKKSSGLSLFFHSSNFGMAFFSAKNYKNEFFLVGINFKKN